MKHNELQKFSNLFVNQEIKRNKTFEGFFFVFLHNNMGFKFNIRFRNY